jgi:hypothetical protein
LGYKIAEVTQFMASDKDIGKKEIEREELALFLEAREVVTGQKLCCLIGLWTESPDFVCSRPDGILVGVELTKVTKKYEIAFWDRLRFGEVQLNPYDTLETIHQLIKRKEEARMARYIQKVDANILVLQLVDGSLNQLRGTFDGLQGDFVRHGFSEIWLADHSGLEAYGDIELFGLFPGQWWGLHMRPWPDRKPYG